MSHIRLVTLLVPYRTSLSCLGQAVSLQKTLLHMYTLVVCPNLCVVASSSQCHSATAHVASHRTTLQQDPSAHVYWESLIVEAKRPQAQNWCCLYRPRRGVSHTWIGCGWVMLTTSFACLTSDWLASLSSDWLILKTSSWQKTLLPMYVWWPVVASGSQRHPATAHVASHNYFKLKENFRLRSPILMMF